MGSTVDQPAGRPRILTGDTPTGRLHLGHYVGSLENRVRLQDEYECYFLLANMHAFTTRADKPSEIRESTLEIVRDWIAVGMDPNRSTFVLQTEVPAIAELTWFLAMLLPFNRVMRNPTLKTEIDAKDLGDTYSFGFPMYAVGQCADILAFRPQLVPVGVDQVAHIEMCREAARRFDQVYCGVDPHAEEEDYEKLGGVFPVPSALVGRVGRLVGTDGQHKMSKSLNNSVFLSDTPKQVKKKINSMYPGQSREPDQPGDPAINPVFDYLDTFCKDEALRAELRDRYTRGDNLGDGHVKAAVIDSVNELLEPMRARRAELEGPGGDDAVIDIIKAGAVKANAQAEHTLALAKDAMGLNFGDRRSMLGL